MAERVVLHVGAMKSGTSYIQARLLANQDVLREQGFLYPGRTWREQVLAVTDVLGERRAGPVSDFRGVGAWGRGCPATPRPTFHPTISKPPRRRSRASFVRCINRRRPMRR